MSNKNSEFEYLVSVCVTFYNHENFVEKALESIFEQEGDFDIEVIICDDCSTDQTNSRILHLIKGKENVSYLRQPTNLGVSKNFQNCLNKSRGKYVAVIDGDDYWVDKLKLKKQIDFLEKNKQFSCCFTDTLIITDNIISNTGQLKPKHKRNISLETVLDDGFWIPTSTFFYRRELLIHPLPEIYNKIKMVDIFLFHLLLINGDIGYIDEVTAIYRKHDNGIWTSLNLIKKLDFRIENSKKMMLYFSNYNVLKEKFKNQVKGSSRQKREILFKRSFFYSFALKIYSLIKKK
jgi:glycosyltransferase involved in cell wall biosynthesis